MLGPLRKDIIEIEEIRRKIQELWRIKLCLCDKIDCSPVSIVSARSWEMPQLCSDPAMQMLDPPMAWSGRWFKPCAVASGCCLLCSSFGSGMALLGKGWHPHLSLPDKPWPSVCMGLGHLWATAGLQLGEQRELAWCLCESVIVKPGCVQDPYQQLIDLHFSAEPFERIRRKRSGVKIKIGTSLVSYHNRQNRLTLGKITATCGILKVCV